MKSKFLTLLLLGAAAVWSQTPVGLIRPQPGLPTITMHVEKIALSSLPAGAITVANGVATFTYSLASPPIPGMGAIFTYQSSQAGSDNQAAIAPISGSVAFTLTAIPFTAADVITIVYWSAR